MIASSIIIGLVVCVAWGFAPAALVMLAIVGGMAWWWFASVRIRVIVERGRVTVRGLFHRRERRASDIVGTQVVPVADGSDWLVKWPVMRGSPSPGDVRFDVGGMVGLRVAARGEGTVLVVFRDPGDASRCASAMRG